jgi:putative tributyrin esterase
MARSFRICLIILVLAALTAGAQAQLAQVKTVDFEAPSVGRKMRYNIILPKDYEDTDKRYPTLYLLHGLTSNYAAWAECGAKIHAPAYDLIVVMPDAGNSWYVNWAGGEGEQKNNWGDYLVKDLVGHIDATYRTIAQREGRAINGLSMGGFGALALGLRHPDIFCSIGSHSGAISYARSEGARLRRAAGQQTNARRARPGGGGPDFLPEGFRTQVERTPEGKPFLKPEDADAFDPFQLALKVPKEKMPHLYLDCGTEDRLIESSQELMKLLMANKIPFTYAQSPGEHRVPYWTRELGHSMAVQYSIIQRNLRRLEKK